jgi:hypothetical protein
MKIEVKNIKINKSFSEETICFTADVFVNGVKTAYAKNDGRGGCTWINNYEGKAELLKQAEAFAKTLPSHFYEYGDRKMEIESTLDGIVDTAVDNKFNEGERARFEKTLKKHMETDFCFGVPNSGAYKRIGYGKHTLARVVMTNRIQAQKLLDRIRKEECINGVEILNTNLTELGLV